MDTRHAMRNEAGGSGQSTVGSCGVTMCMYNQQHQCTAGSIQVALVDGMAHCATYSPQDGAIGIGSDMAQDTSTPASNRPQARDDSMSA